MDPIKLAMAIVLAVAVWGCHTLGVANQEAAEIMSCPEHVWDCGE